jgi:Holliday junction resolvase RusA-like endonuclease
MQEVTVRIALNPVPLARHRVARSGGQYLPPKSKRFAVELREKLSMHYSDEPLEGPLSVKMHLQRRHIGREQCGDLTNMVKAIEDAGNGLLWKDDRQIKHLDATLLNSGDIAPLIHIEVSPWLSAYTA